MRKIRRRRPKQTDRRRQRDVLCDVMLSARECETWLTLDELARLTHYPPASISAQLRHLRKPQFGGFVVRKRQRTSGKILRGKILAPFGSISSGARFAELWGGSGGGVRGRSWLALQSRDES